jgi:cytochrome b involved in lipid metabolism
MKPLDIVKIMMGIYSERVNIKRFMNNSKVWAKFQDFDYEELLKQATTVVNQFYIDQVHGMSAPQSLSNGPDAKKRKFNEL